MGGFDLEDRERIAAERRHWVRLTRRCNNRCVFCLDADLQDGSIVAWSDVLRDLEEGRRLGADRVVLSGGEPTIHPRFLEVVAQARRMGYQWVQVVSNGRMFAYRAFAERAVHAGLSEATLSLPAHEPELFRRLTAVPEAFEQAVAGLDHLLRLGVVVSVDVVVTAWNAPVLPEILSFYLARGVREFDLLQVVPFGRAFRNLERLALDPNRHGPALRRAIRLGEEAGAVIWTNRMDPRLLEGLELYIQDPHKLGDEVRGRREHLRAKVAGRPMPCRDERRCAACFLRGYCDALDGVLEGLGRGRLWLRIRGWDGRTAQLWAAGSFAGLWIQAWDLAGSLQVLEAANAAGFEGPVILELQTDQGLDRVGLPAQLVQLRLASAPAHPEAIPPSTPVALPLTRQVWDAIQAWHRPVVLYWPERTRAALARDLDLSPGVLRETTLPQDWRLEGAPECLAPGHTVRGPEPVDALIFGDGATVDPEAFVDFFVRRLYRVWSGRCAGCPCRPGCPGLPIQCARAFGMSFLDPAACQFAAPTS